MEINVNELSGPALDWAVGEVIVLLGKATKDPDAVDIPFLSGAYLYGPGKRTNRFLPDGREYITHGCGSRWNPSERWCAGGSLFDEYAISMDYYDGWLVAVEGGDARGCTKLEAFCRAIVSVKLGTVVNVPDELL